MRLFLKQGRLTREVVLAFLIYLISHGRPLHEVLRPRFKDVRGEYERAFRGMTVDDVPVGELEQARADLVEQLHARFTADDRAFLLSVADGHPQWNLLPLEGVANLPAIRWKLRNIALMAPAKQKTAAEALRRALELI